MSKFLVCRLRRSFLCDAESGNDVGAKTLQLNYNVTGSQFCTHFPLRQSEAAVVLMQSDSLHSRTRMRTNYWLCCKHYAFKLSNPCLNFSLQRNCPGTLCQKTRNICGKKSNSIAARTIYYFYREHNKTCLCGINLVFVLRYA